MTVYRLVPVEVTDENEDSWLDAAAAFAKAYSPASRGHSEWCDQLKAANNAFPIPPGWEGIDDPVAVMEAFRKMREALEATHSRLCEIPLGIAQQIDGALSAARKVMPNG
jgi:hypothetical protein